METSQRVRLAGWCGIAGGLFYFAHSRFGDASPPGSLGFSLAAAVAAVSFVLLLLGFMGIAWGNALGGRFGTVVFGAAAGGYALMISGALLMVAGVGPITDPVQAVSLVYLLGRLITVVFTVGTGIAVLVARQWQGWTRLAPLALGVWPLVGEAGYAVLTGNTPNGMVNGMWGLWGALLGLATLAQLRPARTRSPGARLAAPGE